jgi:putative ABC transport system substrate-binding protein
MAPRAVLTAILGVALLVTSLAEAQSAGKIYRMGFLAPGPGDRRPLEAFREGLRELGWIEGQNITMELRSEDGRLDRLPDLAAELVRPADRVRALPATKGDEPMSPRRLSAVGSAEGMTA